MHIIYSQGQKTPSRFLHKHDRRFILMKNNKGYVTWKKSFKTLFFTGGAVNTIYFCFTLFHPVFYNRAAPFAWFENVLALVPVPPEAAIVV